MDGRRLGQAVREAHLENVANPALDGWARDLAVEPPGLEGCSGSNGPIHLAGLEVYRDDGPAGVGARGVIRLAVCGARVGGRPVNDGAVMVRRVILV